MPDIFHMRMNSGEKVETPYDREIELCGIAGFVVHEEFENDWRVSHKETGALVARGRSPEDAMSKARRKANYKRKLLGSVQVWINKTHEKIEKEFGKA